MDTTTALLTCLTCRHPASEHRDDLGCFHSRVILTDTKPIVCVCLGLELQ